MDIERVKKLRNKGYKCDLIFDIGANQGLWTMHMMGVFPESNYLLFEANTYPHLHALAAKDQRISSYTHTILNEVDCEVDWYELYTTGDSMFKENTHNFKNCVPKKRQSVTMDTFVKTQLSQKDREKLEQSKNILVKIDCQGAEVPILKGFPKHILEKTDFVMLEVPFFGQYNQSVPTFVEHIQFMDQLGFIPYDIVEMHYIRDFNSQIDMIFINKNHPLIKIAYEEVYNN